MLVFIALVGLASCSATRPDPRILLDPAVGLEVESVQVRRNRSDTIDVQALGSNRRGYDVQAQYKLEWIDDDGMYVSTILSRWVVLRVAAGEPFRIEGTAPTPAASNFRLQIRKNRAKGYE